MEFPFAKKGRPGCRSGFTTLSPERPTVVLLRGMPLALLVVRSG
jgi:hypothetical protein